MQRGGETCPHAGSRAGSRLRRRLGAGRPRNSSLAGVDTRDRESFSGGGSVAASERVALGLALARPRGSRPRALLRPRAAASQRPASAGRAEATIAHVARHDLPGPRARRRPGPIRARLRRHAEPGVRGRHRQRPPARSPGLDRRSPRRRRLAVAAPRQAPTEVGRADARLSRTRSAFSPSAPSAYSSVTGLYYAGRQVASLDALLTTLYGKALLSQGRPHARRRRPRPAEHVTLRPQLAAPPARLLRRPDGWTPLPATRLRSLLVAEAALGLGLLVAVGVLTATPPARGPSSRRLRTRRRRFAAARPRTCS